MKTTRVKMGLILLLLGAGAPMPVAHAERADAIYRDGAFSTEYLWHAGLLYAFWNDDDPDQVVLHAAGQYEHSVQLSGFSSGANNFVGSNVFKGRRSKGNPPKWRRDIIIETGIFQLTANYWNGIFWKRPNSSFQSGDGNFRCDGVVEYCYESAGLDPCVDSEIYPIWGPKSQYDRMDAAVQTAPSNVVMRYPSSSDIGTATIIPGTNMWLWASATDEHSGLAWSGAFRFYYCSYTGTAWTAWFALPPSDCFFQTAAYYRYYCWRVTAYDNDCMLANSINYYGYSVPVGALQVNITPYTVVTNGARWRVDGGAWTNSGATVWDIRSDSNPHLVEFSPMANWTVPPAQNVTVSDGQTLSASGVYVRHQGSLVEMITPPEVYGYGARWQLDNGYWHYGNTYLTLDTGIHSINYGYVNGWDAPTNVSLMIAKDTTITNTGVYARHTGAVGDTLYPSAAVTAGARWRVDSGAWTNSGAIVSGLTLGNHLVEFLPLSGWQAPASFYSYLGAKGQTNTYSSTYAPRGAICFHLQPVEAATNGAAWFLGDGIARTNNETVGNLPAQSTFVWFRSVAGWLTPASTYLTVQQGQTTTGTATYARNYAGVRTYIYPAGAVAAGAMWRVDGGTWTNSGSLVSNLLAGAHTVQFKPVVDWVAPADWPFVASPGEQVSVSWSYTPASYLNVYVSTNGGNIYPYTNWSNAARAIQPAVNAATAGGLVLVSNGVYAGGMEIQITNNITVRSVNGPDVTVVAGSPTNRCFSLNHAAAVVDGLTLTNGNASLGGGALLSAGGTLRNCIIRNCTAGDYGGGVFLGPGGVVTRCTLRDNTAVANDAGAVYLNQGGMVSESIMYSNSARKAGGVFLYNGGAMRNCLVYGNTARGGSEGGTGGGVLCYKGTGTVDNCTIVSNTAQADGGGVFCNAGGIIRNSVVVNNTAPNSPNRYNSGGIWASCCTTPTIGSGCVAADPMFQSPGKADYRLHPSSLCVDAGSNLDWTASSVDLQGYPRKVGTSPDIGAYECTPTHYVALAGLHVSPFLAASNAAVDIQSAVNAAENGDTVVIAAGTYTPGSNVAVAAGMRLQGAGMGQTLVSGGNVHRVFLLLTNAVLENLSVIDGYDGATGGGIQASGGAVIRGCEVRNCTAWNTGGGGIFIDGSGAVSNAWVHHNRTVNGGGGGILLQYGGTVFGCTVEANSGPWGGGIFCRHGGEVINSVIRANTANHNGGGLEGFMNVSVRGCLIVHNASAEFGSGMLVIGPTTTVANCTLVANACSADSVGGLATSSVNVENTVAWGNTAALGTSPDLLLSGSTVSNSCAPGLSGNGCVATAPAFADATTDDYRLTVGSPCVDSGVLRGWMDASTDLDGIARVVGAGVDMGAYELTPVHYALPSGSAPAYPYTAWGTAADSIQNAVDAAGMGDTVIAGDGTFEIRKAVSITKRLSLGTLHGAGATAMAGRRERGTRCLDVSAAATVDGFTITGGWGETGGAVALSAGASLRACVIKDNQAVKEGGGLWISGAGSAENCLITGNSCPEFGGGALLEQEGGRLFACVIVSNTADRGGGVSLKEGGWLQNDLLHDNASTGIGGGIHATGGRVENCTVVCNTSPDAAGIFSAQADVQNTIVYYNHSKTGRDVVDEESRWSYNCTPEVIGKACQTREPRFIDPDLQDFHLRADSVCVDAGTCGPVVDLDGRLRPLDGVCHGWPDWDIGAFEYLNLHADTDQDGMEDGWECVYFGGPTNGVSAMDADGDGALNREEFEAGTDPLDNASRLRIVGIGRTSGAMRVDWVGGSSSWQYVESAADLGALDWTPVYTQAPPTALSNCFIDDGCTNTRGFYRIRAHHPAPP